MIVIGLENEFTAWSRSPKELVKPYFPKNPAWNRYHLNLFPSYEEQPDEWIAAGRGSSSFWLSNGGRVYVDRQAYEYATPECETLKNLVLADKAGDIIQTNLFNGANDDPRRIFLMKRSAGTIFTGASLSYGDQQHASDQTWGSHENYLVSERLFRKITEPLEGKPFPAAILFALHLASRQVYTGAGHLQISGAPHGSSLVFWISPRAAFITQFSCTSTVSNRPLINTRNDHHAIGTWSGARRLHVIVGDMNRSDWSVYLKFGTTLAVLLALEFSTERETTSFLRGIDADNIDVLELLRRGSTPFKGNAERDAFSKLLDIQKRIIDFILPKKDFITGQFPEFEEVLASWQEALDSAATTSGVFTRKLDWMIKRRLFEEASGMSIGDLMKIDSTDAMRRLAKLDFAYHRIHHGDLYEDLLEHHLAESLYSERDASWLVASPPPGRASRRTHLAHYLIEKRLTKCILCFDWSYVRLEDPRPLKIEDKETIVQRVSREILFDDTPLDVLKSKVAEITGTSL